MSRIGLQKKILKRRLILCFIIAISYVFGLLIYNFFGKTYENFRFYYLRSYASALQTTIAGFGKHTAYSSSTSNARSIPVLLYHGILSESDGTNIGLNTFIDQMKTLKKNGFQTITVEQMYDFLNGKTNLPPHSFMITFDDGRKDSYYPADPILRALGFKAVMFAIADFSSEKKSSYYLTKNEIQNMARTGRWQIESHTRTHRNLPEIPVEELPNEIVESKSILEGIIKKPIIAFAFPFGEFGEKSIDPYEEIEINSLANSNYKLSFFQFSTSMRFTQNYPQNNETSYLVKRIGIKPDWSGEYLLSLLKSGEAKDVPFKAKFNSSDGWINTLWGNMYINNSNLEIGAVPESSGSVVILDGSMNWKNYEYSANIDWLQGSNFYLWARYKDDKNYVSCNFGKDRVHVELTQNGQTSVIRGEVYPVESEILKGNINVAIRVSGRDVSCKINNKTVASTQFLSQTLDHGGVGLKAWDKTLGIAKIRANSINVEEI